MYIQSITKGKLKNDEFKQTTMTDFFGIPNCNPTVDHNEPTGHTSSPDTLKYKKRNVSSNITPKKLSDIIPTQSTTSHTPLTYSRPVKPQTKSPALRKALFELNTSTDEHIDVFDSIDLSQLMCRVDGIDNNGLYQLPLVYIVTSVTKERHEEYGRWTEEQVLQLTRDNTTYECCLRDIWYALHVCIHVHVYTCIHVYIHVCIHLYYNLGVKLMLELEMWFIYWVIYWIQLDHYIYLIIHKLLSMKTIIRPLLLIRIT